MFDRNVFICAFSFLLTGIIIRFILQRPNYLYGVNDLPEKQTQHTELIVGILSARENFEQRQAIRDTWLTQEAFSSEGQVKVFKAKPWFILGSKPCSLPPAYRLNKYGCEKWEFNASDLSETFFTSSDVNNKSFHPDDFRTFHQGFSFQVNHPVIVTSLGVFSKLLHGSQNASIALMNLQTKDVVVKTVISSEQYDSLVNGFLYNNVETFLLPKGYEGLVLVEGHLLNSDSTTTQWYNGAGVISFNRVYRNPNDVESIQYSRHLSVAPSIGFSIHEIPALMSLQYSEVEAINSWQLSQRRILKKLKIETKKWNDILLLDVVDTYRNIPLKLLQFYEWLSKTESFSYLLKTDDDCVVDIPVIIEELKDHAKFNSSEMWWWSRFRAQWPVNFSGKWADYSYKSPIYPSFPCGGGYVLSRGVVSWIAANVPFLFPYQGEDASMGVWLSAINPLYIEDDKWECDNSCKPKSFNRAQLTVDEMSVAWSSYLECGNICSCNKI